jgi:quinol-cytochrome oxidoreductase complex cytochrome b subunit
MNRLLQSRSDGTNSPVVDRKIVERPAQPILRQFKSRRTWWVLGAFALIVACVMGLKVYAHLKSFERTNDAFISVHYTLILYLTTCRMLVCR